jgi:hypothetical protein
MTARSSQSAFLDGRLRLRSPAVRQLTSVLNWLASASLLLAGDGTAVAANESWAFVSGVPAADSRGDGWLQAVDPRDRPSLHALIMDAAATRLAGATDCRIGPDGAESWSRWCWGPGPAGGLIVSVVSFDVARTCEDRLAAIGGLADMVAHRLFRVGLVMQSAAQAASQPWQRLLREAGDEVDSVIRDVRSASS